MPTMFELLSSEVSGPKRKPRPKWAGRRDEPTSPFMSAPVEREMTAQVPAGGMIQAGTDSGDETTPETPTPAFDENDPVGSISAAEKSGFFDSLQGVGAAMMMMSGDKQRSAMGLSVMRGQASARQFQQREKRLTGEAAVREKRLQSQAEFSRGIQAADLRLKETDTVMKTAKEIDAISDPAQKRNAFLLATKQLAHSPTAGALLAGMVQDPANGTAIAMTRKVTDKFQQFGLKAQALGGEKAGEVLLKKFPTVEHGLDAMALKGDLSAEDRNYLRNNPAVVESIGNVMGWPATEAVRKAQAAKLQSETVQTEGARTASQLAQEAGLKRGTPEYQAFIREKALKPANQINFGEKEMDKRLAQIDTDMVKGVLEKGDTARAQQPQIDAMKETLKSGLFKFGTLADARTEVGRFFETLGVDSGRVNKLIGGAQTAEVFDASVNQLFSESAKDMDRSMKLSLTGIQKSLPQLYMTPEGNNVLVTLLERVNANKIAKADLTEQYWSEHGTTRAEGQPSLRKLLNEFDTKNPVVDDALKEQISALGKDTEKMSWKDLFAGGIPGAPGTPAGGETETITVTEDNKDQYPGLELGTYRRKKP